MRKLYYEPFAGGHRADYLGALLSHCGNEWSVACPQNLFNQLEDCIQSRFAPKGSICHIPIESRSSSTISSTLQMWNEAHKLAEEHECSQIFFSEIDLYIKYSFFLRDFRKPIFGVFFRPIMHYPDLNLREKFIGLGQKVALRRFFSASSSRRVLTLDRSFCDWAKCNGLQGNGIGYLPDLSPVDCENALKEKSASIIDTQPSRTKFLLFGALQRRKGVFELVDAIERLRPEIAARSSFAVLGRIYPDAAGFGDKLDAVAKSTDAQIIFREGFLTTNEIATLVAESDVILAPYLRHRGSSGLLYWAAAFGKPVVTQDFGQIGREVREYQLGAVIEEMTADNLAHILSRIATERSVPFSPSGQAGFVSGHDARSFCKAIEHPLFICHE